MSGAFISSYHNPQPYIPASLSEIYDYLAPMIGQAPTFIDKSGIFIHQNIDTEFDGLVQGFDKVRNQLGEDNHAAAVALAARAKALFVDDPEETNGKTMEGIKLLYEIEDIIQSVRRRRVKTKQRDEDGEVSGD